MASSLESNVKTILQVNLQKCKDVTQTQRGNKLKCSKNNNRTFHSLFGIVRRLVREGGHSSFVWVGTSSAERQNEGFNSQLIFFCKSNGLRNWKFSTL